MRLKWWWYDHGRVVKDFCGTVFVIACGIIAADLLATVLRFLYGIGVGLIVVLT